MSDEGRSPMRWLVGAALATGALVSLARPAWRKRATESLSRASAWGQEQLSASLRTLQEGATRIGRVALLPADATLELARDRVLSGVPEAADTKWRAAGLVLRSTVVEATTSSPQLAAAALETAGRTYAEASSPGAGWDAVTIREAVRRMTRSLDMESSEQRLGDDVESRTTRCPLLEAMSNGSGAQLCEAVCGEERSLMHGLAASAGWELRTAERMGTGASECVRLFRVSSPPSAPAPSTDTASAEGVVGDNDGAAADA